MITLYDGKPVPKVIDFGVAKATEQKLTEQTLFADVQRYLNNEPVLACPPSTMYRVRKLVRRNRGLVLAASLLLLALLGGMIGTTLGMFRAASAQAVAVHAANEKDAALTAKTAALVVAKTNERAKTEQLWQALVAQAHKRLSRQPGQRFESLEILNRAARLGRTLDLPAARQDELRNAFIGTLALPDLSLSGPWVTWPTGSFSYDFDESHAIHARTDRQRELQCSARGR